MTAAWDHLKPGVYIFNEGQKKGKPSGCFRHYKRWTDEDVAICADFTKSDEQVAAELCRTVAAITQKRSTIRFCIRQARRKRYPVRPTT